MKVIFVMIQLDCRSVKREHMCPLESGIKIPIHGMCTEHLTTAPTSGGKNRCCLSEPVATNDAVPQWGLARSGKPATQILLGHLDPESASSTPDADIALMEQVQSRTRMALYL